MRYGWWAALRGILSLFSIVGFGLIRRLIRAGDPCSEEIDEIIYLGEFF